MEAAIAGSTRKTYDSALQAYQRWCGEQRPALDPSPLAITVASAGNYLASRVDDGSLMARSLLVHRSALSTAWVEAAAAASPPVSGDNPLQAVALSRVLDGAAKALRGADAGKRASRPVTVSLTPDMLARCPAPNLLAPRDTRAIARWAAAHVGVYGCLRPGEFLGDEAAVRAEEVRFFDAQMRAMELMRSCWEAQTKEKPTVAKLRLGPTKADQFAHNEPVTIAAAAPIAALWAWMHTRRAAGAPPDGPLFAIPGERTLSINEMNGVITSWLELVTGERVKVTGRAYRRGGASALIAAGAPIPDAQLAGRWATPRMPLVYADAAAREAQALAVARSLDPAAGRR
jgi:hypothetical protein